MIKSKNYYKTYNCTELDLSYLKKDNWKLYNERVPSSIYTKPNKINEFNYHNTTIISIKKEFINNNNIKCKYDNIFFDDFVLTNCEIIKFKNIILILAKKVTLI